MYSYAYYGYYYAYIAYHYAYFAYYSRLPNQVLKIRDGRLAPETGHVRPRDALRSLKSHFVLAAVGLPRPTGASLSLEPNFFAQ